MNDQKIELKASDDELKGRYANAMQISHSQQEFVLDFLLIHPPVGQLTSRIITSPAHAKRIAAAIQDNIKKYESSFGKIDTSEEPKSGIGFKA